MSVPPEHFNLKAIAPQPWKNGAGLTREIAFGGASAAAFNWRISLAEVTRDAPFSAFPGVDRCIVLLRGAGMRLRSAEGAIDHELTTPLAPFNFPGDVVLDARLIGGACSDFNVMTRRGAWRSEVRCERGPTALLGGDVTMLLCGAGEWQITGAEPSTLTPLTALTPLGPLQALLWRAPVGPLRAEPRVDDSALLVVRLCHDRSS